MKKTLLGQIENILFEENGFFIARLKSSEKISGTYYESDVSNLKGVAVTLQGEWQEHQKYGKTFKFTSLHVNQDELFFFLNRIVKGFTKKLSAELIEKFGHEGLVDILDNNIERLLEFKGIKEKRLKKIQASWKKFRWMRKLGEYLSPYDISAELLTTIATAMKDVEQPYLKIKDNPYILTKINGIGFKRADELALKMGVRKDADIRISNAMDYLLLDHCEQQGNSCVDKETLFLLLDELLETTNQEALYEAALIQRVSEQTIVPMQNNRFSPAKLYDAEKFLYDDFVRRLKLKSNPLVSDIDEFLKKGDLILGKQQKEAVSLINAGTSVLFLVGYAGTGKSTTAKTILNLLNTKFEKNEIMTCALSGIASQRIAETTGYASSTIQSLLIRYEHEDEFPFAVLLVDEASMINSLLFAKLIKKLKKDCILIVVGDDAQLPPIGAGNILSDVLALELVPIVKLTKIYRQSEEQAIALIANDIRRTNVPDFRREYDDFIFIDVSIPNYYAQKNFLSKDEFSKLREQNSNDILAIMIQEAVKVIPKARLRLKNKEISSYLYYFQVITPMKGGTLGVTNLNRVLQEYFNPNPKKSVKRGLAEFRLMDKVVHVKNENMPTWSTQDFKEKKDSNQKRVFNGMVGLLFRIDEEEEQAYVYYPNEDMVVLYEFEQLKSHLSLSYALTIHKVQGQEYDIVIIPITFSHYIMHNTKLMYTAITRAKHRCILVGESAAFESACKRVGSTKRDTVLLEL